MTVSTKKKLLACCFADDVRDAVVRKNEVYSEEMIARHMGKAAEAGFTTMLWRVRACGRATYPSNVARRLDGSGLTPQNSDSAVFDLIQRRYDTLAVAAEQAHAHGLEFLTYLVLHDDYYPGFESIMALRRPDLHCKHRREDHHLLGCPAYGFDEMRQHRWDEVRELLDYPGDGLYLDVARSHASIQPLLTGPSHPVWVYYGFEEPVRALVRERHGYDMVADGVDPEHQARARGHFLTEWMRQTAKLVHEKQRQLVIGAYTDAETWLSREGTRVRTILGNYHIDLEGWASEGLIDGLVNIVEHRRSGVTDWNRHSRETLADVRRNGVAVYLWVATEARWDDMILREVPGRVRIEEDRDLYLDILEEELRAALASDADGVMCFQDTYIEQHDYWGNVASAFNCA